jgi:hypothetical protein
MAPMDSPFGGRFPSCLPDSLRHGEGLVNSKTTKRAWESLRFETRAPRRDSRINTEERDAGSRSSGERLGEPELRGARWPPMRTRIPSLFGLALAVGTLSCSGAGSFPPLNACCVVPAADGTIVCFCGASTTPGDAFTVRVSGSTCTVTSTNDGGGDVQVHGAPPQAQTDCANPQGG